MARLETQMLYCPFELQARMFYTSLDCDGIPDVVAPSYPVRPFLSIRDDEVTRLILSLMRLTRKSGYWEEGRRIALVINPLLLRDSSSFAYSNSCRDTLFGW